MAIPRKRTPQGTWSKPADGIDWRIEWTYGTGVKEKFKGNDTGVGGGKTYFGVDKATTGTWGAVGAKNLKNPLPAGSSIRVQLLRRESCTWVMKKEDFIEIP